MEKEWIKRWRGMGPYYAMFPYDFATRVVRKYTREGDIVLDPFAGRGTAVFASAANNRRGIGIEINPVGWIFGKTKIEPAQQKAVENRLVFIASQASAYADAAKVLPKFFHVCFSKDTLCFLLAARDLLKWRTNKPDRTLMAVILVDLHGKRGVALSNQMRQTKAMSPQYSIKWWKAHRLVPLNIDPVSLIKNKLKWRYAHKFCTSNLHKMYLGDSRKVLSQLRPKYTRKVSLILTSPPYCGVTNYFYDQWLRLWMLGGANRPESQENEIMGRFNGKEKYEELLRKVFLNAKRLLKRDGVVYIRTDSRKFTLETTLKVLKELFPQKRIKRMQRPTPKRTQTKLFDPAQASEDEVDIVVS